MEASLKLNYQLQIRKIKAEKNRMIRKLGEIYDKIDSQTDLLDYKNKQYCGVASG